MLHRLSNSELVSPFLISCVVSLVFFLSAAHSKDLLTNAALIKNSPEWITQGRINRIADRVQSQMEWTIRRVQVQFISDPTQFTKMHSLGPWPIAVSKKNENTVLLGPKINKDNFDKVFAHELVHIIAFQKYKEAIPKWLEEGLANYFSKDIQANYQWIKTQPFPDDVKNLVHLLKGNENEVRLHYALSLSLAEMLAKKCDLKNLMRLSVGQRMEPYIETYCQIKDLTQALKTWISSK